MGINDDEEPRVLFEFTISEWVAPTLPSKKDSIAESVSSKHAPSQTSQNKGIVEKDKHYMQPIGNSKKPSAQEARKSPPK